MNSSINQPSSQENGRRPAVLTIAELLSKDRYLIPIYQRNYAWGEAEVSQLIRDIADVGCLPKGVDSEKVPANNYYIGSLIVYGRANGEYETIDGQQRLTTLGIIYAALKNECQINQERIDAQQIHSLALHFDCRRQSDQTLKHLFKDGLQGSHLIDAEKSMIHAYQIATKTIKLLLPNLKDRQCFFDFLMQKIKILRVQVPTDTDLNHYFEIMNSRGEQLEKHEVLKARLMEKLQPGNEQQCFSKIWSACAEMNIFAQLGFKKDVRIKLLGERADQLPFNFDQIQQAIGTDNGAITATSFSIKDILEGESRNSPQAKEQENTTSNFKSIVTFPNFLLHVLRVYLAEDIALDDKQLLKEFEGQMQALHLADEQARFVKEFAVALLRCRLLFDRYIIKRENDKEWTVKSFVPNSDTKLSHWYNNSFERDQQYNQKIVMIQAMFHVSFPSMTYKHWLNAILKFLWEQATGHAICELAASTYLDYLERFNDRLFFGLFGKDGKLSFFDIVYGDNVVAEGIDEKEELHKGTSVHNYIFNRLDYLLWKKCKSDEVFMKGRSTELKQKSNHFHFAFRSSVEHYYPQHPLANDFLENVDRFGNLCLIDADKNSYLNNQLPEAKKKAYINPEDVDSLKLAFMMEYKEWSKSTMSDINAHEVEMIGILTTKYQRN